MDWNYRKTRAGCSSLGELPFVTSSAVYENPYRPHVVVTSDSEDDLQKLKDLDTAGSVLEIEYAPQNTII